MDKRDAAVFVGNGLLFDFLHRPVPDPAAWNPQNPTRSALQPRLADGRRLIEVLPRFRRYCEEARAANSALTDFEIFDSIVRRDRKPEPVYAGDDQRYEKAWDDRYEDELLEVEARHFVVGAYSAMHEELILGTELSDWAWRLWMDEHRARLRSVVSYNYDLLVEHTLESIGIRYQRVGLSDPPEFGRVSIIKPHGSIDFFSRIIEAPREYPLRNCISRIGGPIGRLQSLCHARLDAEVVLPAEASAMREYYWVRAGRRRWRDIAPRIRHVVIVG
jgi:hypothetical protein